MTTKLTPTDRRQIGEILERRANEIAELADDFKSQYQHGGITFDEFDSLGFGKALLSRAGRTPIVTDDMVAAYLKANDAYWKRTDELPGKADKWRNGTPAEATRESLISALAAVGAPYTHADVTAAHPAPAPVDRDLLRQALEALSSKEPHDAEGGADIEFREGWNACLAAIRKHLADTNGRAR